MCVYNIIYKINSQFLTSPALLIIFNNNIYEATAEAEPVGRIYVYTTVNDKRHVTPWNELLCGSCAIASATNFTGNFRQNVHYIIRASCSI